jgi:outer membrane receptor protein involved in Fe transport
MNNRLKSITVLMSLASSLGVYAQNTGDSLEEITIYGSSPLTNASGESLPYAVQSFSTEDLNSSAYTSIADFLDRQANGVNVNQAQNNVLQPDIQVRGFSASPLLGAPQGVAVYLNGARINEPFGDTVNWDLLAPSIINRLNLISGANAVYGLNALGASLTLASKTGFDNQGGEIDFSAGSFGRKLWSLSQGGNNSRWGYFLNLSGFEEDGWRDFSPTDALNAYGALSLRDEKFEWDLFGLWGDTELHGNGASPEELLKINREAVFTHPDITENNLMMLSSRGQWFFANDSSIAVNGFYRDNDTDSFNGDGSEYEECDPPLAGFLCDDDDPSEAVEDQFGDNVADSFDAINNISEREQLSWGGAVEYRLSTPMGGREHHHIVGLDFYTGDTVFESMVEFAELQTDRSTNRSGLFDEEGETELDSTVSNIGLYWLDSFDTSEKLNVTLSLRYNSTRVETQDQSGEAPELNGDHGFAGLNGGIGGLYHLNASTDVFANLHQSSRAPSPVELACSHPDAPCTLPNTFLADPPLDEVIARNLEVGLRRQFDNNLYWEISSFLTLIKDDIVFQTTGGVSSNEGFFSNASATQRLGLSTLLSGEPGNVKWQLAYTWLQATFQDDFLVSSPNHPAAIDNQIAVERGDQIPGLPQHTLRASLDWRLNSALTWNVAGHYQSGVYLRGDEGNQDSKTGTFFIANTNFIYRFSDELNLYLLITNLFDTEYETFGLYGEPDEVIPSLGDENTRFISPSEPRGAWMGLRYLF